MKKRPYEVVRMPLIEWHPADIRRRDVGIASRSTLRDDRDMPKEVSKQGVVSPSELTQRARIQCTNSDEDDDRVSVLSDSPQSGPGDSEDAVILTARRVRIIRCCQGKQTTLPSVRLKLETMHDTQVEPLLNRLQLYRPVASCMGVGGFFFCTLLPGCRPLVEHGFLSVSRIKGVH